MSAEHGEVTLLLKAMKSGDKSAAEKLLPLVYNELHRLARSYMQRERSDHTLQPTALINEAYLRLARDTVVGKAASTLSEWLRTSCVVCSSITQERVTPG
jgi:DNA-directed RNA polymerase specialized sigma24 family protein